jgi:hypothetical protein
MCAGHAVRLHGIDIVAAHVPEMASIWQSGSTIDRVRGTPSKAVDGLRAVSRQNQD